MKVAHLIDSGGYYGAEIMLVNLCLEQIKNGITVLVISIGTQSTAKKALEEKLNELGIPFLRWNMMSLPDVRQSFEILNHCAEHEIDVIHSHGYKGNILLGLIPQSKRSVPVITTIHGYTKHKALSKMTVYQAVDRWCLRNLDAVILVSQSMTHQIPSKNLAQKLYVVDNGIPTEDAPEKSTPYISHFSDEDFKIGSLGRLSYEKNFSMLIEAFVKVQKLIPSAKLVIYGEGPERFRLEQKIKDLALQERILLPGFLNGTSEFLNELDIFVNCSITEGMPISVLEAMRNACPVIATKIPANHTILDGLNNENMFCDLNAESLADRIIKFYRTETSSVDELRERYTENFKLKYTVEIMERKYHSIYQQVLSK
jgi:glycosyltransferase involved in cell wall biosynthesis